MGNLAPKATVVVFDKKELKDGSLRAQILSIKGSPVVIAAALNEFNHSIQRFGTAIEYESARVSYCEDMMAREEYVEDAITGNMLRIKDQTLHVSTATDVQDNRDIPTEWRVDDVRDLAALLLKPSPSRSMGTHPAQPVLMRAGPGTGKTWMIKQAAFAIAETLRETKMSSGGIRLVPMVMCAFHSPRLPQPAFSTARLFHSPHPFPSPCHMA